MIVFGLTSQQDNKDHDMGDEKSRYDDHRDEKGCAKAPIFGVSEALRNSV